MDMSDDENQHPKKKHRIDSEAADGDSVPRWSNPDPYTALPPPDDSQRKKKDVVKLIRKARVETNSSTVNKIDAADDFISFDFGDEEDDQEEEEEEKDDDYVPIQSGAGVAGAPTGPRFSHRSNFQNQQTPNAQATNETNRYVECLVPQLA